MKRYELRRVGVYDRQAARVLARHDPAWSDYQAWLAAGNAPDPMPVTPPVPPSVEEVAARAEIEARHRMREELRADVGVQSLRTMTPAQVDAWVDGVTGFAEARRVLKTMARIVALLARERIG